MIIESAVYGPEREVKGYAELGLRASHLSTPHEHMLKEKSQNSGQSCDVGLQTEVGLKQKTDRCKKTNGEY